MERLELVLRGGVGKCANLLQLLFLHPYYT